VSAIGFAAGRIYVSDSTGVFEAGGTLRDWRRVSSLPEVVDLTPSSDGSRLYATSATQGVQFLKNGAWHSTDSLASPHQAHLGHENHPEVLSLAPIHGRLYAVGTSFGVSASADDGQTWSQLGGGLESVTPTQLLDYQNTLLAATSDGVYRFPLASGAPASLNWWLVVVLAVVIFGTAGAVLAGFDRLPWSRSKRSNR
jgi:hypothetical protein